MGPVLLQDETGIPGENLRYLVKSHWTTFFSHVTKVTLMRKLHGAGIEPSHSGERHEHYHCATSSYSRHNNVIQTNSVEHNFYA